MKTYTTEISMQPLEAELQVLEDQDDDEEEEFQS